jgi:hypothetical protein
MSKNPKKPTVMELDHAMVEVAELMMKVMGIVDAISDEVIALRKRLEVLEND